MNCLYCGVELPENNKNEHIIHNALGGLLECPYICCEKCNGVLSQQDNKFVNNFSPFVPMIDNYHQTRKSSFKPKHKGRGLYNGKWYEIVLEGNRPVGCAEYSKMNKTGKMPMFDIIKHDIGLENESFKKGMQKIGVNFARYSGVQCETLADNFEVIRDTDRNVCQINFRQQFLPFIPLNSFDKYIEQATLTNLYHMLILFSANNCLYCYIDLFNTWQGYVILSENYCGDEVYKTYVQLVQNWKRPEFNIRDIRRLKDLLIFKQQYGYGEDVFGTFEEQIEKIIKIANEKIRKEPYKRELENFICDKIGIDYANYIIGEMKKIHSLNAHRFYFFIDEQEQELLRSLRFRRLSPLENEKGDAYYSFYPELIWSLLCERKEDFESKIRDYCYSKIARLNDYLSPSEGETIE